MFKRIISEALFLLLAAIILSFVVNSLRPDSIRLFDRSAPEPESVPVKEISIEDAVEKFKAQSAVFVDARDADQYAMGHIPRAICLPQRESDQHMAEFVAKVEMRAELITYCDSQDCELARNLAESLYLAGYERVFYLQAGWEQWVSRNLPMESGR